MGKKYEYLSVFLKKILKGKFYFRQGIWHWVVKKNSVMPLLLLCLCNKSVQHLVAEKINNHNVHGFCSLRIRKHYRDDSFQWCAKVGTHWVEKAFCVLSLSVFIFSDATFVAWNYLTSYGEDFLMEIGKFYKSALLLPHPREPVVIIYLHINSASTPTWSLGTQLLWFQLLVVTWLTRGTVMSYVYKNSTKELSKPFMPYSFINMVLKALCPRWYRRY